MRCSEFDRKGELVEPAADLRNLSVAFVPPTARGRALAEERPTGSLLIESCLAGRRG
jgi:hypothetical protein